MLERGGGVELEAERIPGVKKHPVVPRSEGVIGIRDSGDGHTPVTTKACEECFISLGHGRAGENTHPLAAPNTHGGIGGVWNARQETRDGV